MRILIISVGVITTSGLGKTYQVWFFCWGIQTPCTTWWCHLTVEHAKRSCVLSLGNDTELLDWSAISGFYFAYKTILFRNQGTYQILSRNENRTSHISRIKFCVSSDSVVLCNRLHTPKSCCSRPTLTIEANVNETERGRPHWELKDQNLFIEYFCLLDTWT